MSLVAGDGGTALQLEYLKIVLTAVITSGNWSRHLVQDSEVVNACARLSNSVENASFPASFFDAKTILVDRIRLVNAFTPLLSCTTCRNQLPECQLQGRPSSAPTVMQSSTSPAIQYQRFCLYCSMGQRLSTYLPQGLHPNS